MASHSFLEWSDEIQLGSMVVAYSHPAIAQVIQVTSDGNIKNRFGVFQHADMIGKKFGSRLTSSTGKGFIYLLHPTPELWTNYLPHRTQILYQADISLITAHLRLGPGIKMIETGTGSGSFSHSIARTIYPNGHLYTFEYHQERTKKAQEEFLKHGLSPEWVTIQCRNVCEDGFGSLVENTVQAVFLDLPAPWQAIPHTVGCFDRRYVGRICCYSPCIEQVQQTVKALQENGFVAIKMYETLQKPHEVFRVHNEKWSNPLVSNAHKKSDNKDNQEKKRKMTQEEQEAEKGLSQEEQGERNYSNDKEDSASADNQENRKMNNNNYVTSPPSFDGTLVSRPFAQVRGHTSYLTFAKLMPKRVNQ